MQCRAQLTFAHAIGAADQAEGAACIEPAGEAREPVRNIRIGNEFAVPLGVISDIEEFTPGGSVRYSPLL